MPDDTVANYQEAVRVLMNATDAVSRWRTAILVAAESLKDEAWMSGHLDRTKGEWPNERQLRDGVEGWKKSLHAVQEAYRKIPDDQRVSLKNPDEIRTQEEARFKSGERPAV